MKTTDRNISKILEDIYKLQIHLKKIDRKITPDMVGFYGELLVLKELSSKFEQSGFRVEWGKGQTRSDFALKKGSESPIKVEVKTSRKKMEWYGEKGYGAALNVKKCKDHPNAKFNNKIGDFCYFDYLVLVTLSEDLTPSFYIFPRKLLTKNINGLRNRNPRFKSSSHRIVIPPLKMKRPKMVSAFDHKIAKDKDRFRNRWSSIKPISSYKK